MNEAERHLREIIKTFSKPCASISDHLNYHLEFNKAISLANSYLRSVDACEFQSEDGVRCPDPHVRDSHKMLCCEYHAKMREAWFR